MTGSYSCAEDFAPAPDRREAQGGSTIDLHDREVAQRTPAQWPGNPGFAHGQPQATSRFASLLDADDDLGQGFDVRTRLALRQTITARVLDAGTGACELDTWFEAVGQGPGLLILDGLIAVETRVGDRTAMELIGAGDLLQPPAPRADDLIERIDAWRALCPTRLALLDDEFGDRVRPWPQISEALLRRASRRIADIDAVRAITSQPRLEVRLVLLLWHLGARWGRVEPGGIRVTLPLTHRLLGELVSAERPSISHALSRLSDCGVVTGAAGDWHLQGNLEEHLEALLERGPARKAG